MATLEVVGIPRGNLRALKTGDGWVLSAQDLVAAAKGVDVEKVNEDKLQQKLNKLKLRPLPPSETGGIGPALVYADVLSLLSYELNKKRSPPEELVELKQRMSTNDAAAFLTRGGSSPPSGFALHTRPAVEAGGGFMGLFRGSSAEVVPTPVPTPVPPPPAPATRQPVIAEEPSGPGFFSSIWASISALWASGVSVAGSGHLGSTVRAIAMPSTPCQWYRLRKAGGRYAIPGATGLSYAVRAEDMGCVLEVDVRGEKHEVGRVGPVPWEEAVVQKVQKYWEKGKMLFVQMALVDRTGKEVPCEIKFVRYVFVRTASDTREVCGELKADYENTRIVEVPGKEGLREVILQMGQQKLHLRANSVEEREIFVAAHRIFAAKKCPLTETDRYIADALVNGPARAAKSAAHQAAIAAEYAARHGHEVPLRAGAFVVGTAGSAVQAPFRALKKGYDTQKEAAEKYAYLKEERKTKSKGKSAKREERIGDPAPFPSMNEISRDVD